MKHNFVAIKTDYLFFVKKKKNVFSKNIARIGFLICPFENWLPVFDCPQNRRLQYDVFVSDFRSFFYHRIFSPQVYVLYFKYKVCLFLPLMVNNALVQASINKTKEITASDSRRGCLRLRGTRRLQKRAG